MYEGKSKLPLTDENLEFVESMLLGFLEEDNDCHYSLYINGNDLCLGTKQKTISAFSKMRYSLPSFTNYVKLIYYYNGDKKGKTIVLGADETLAGELPQQRSNQHIKANEDTKKQQEENRLKEIEEQLRKSLVQEYELNGLKKENAFLVSENQTVKQRIAENERLMGEWEQAFKRLQEKALAENENFGFKAAFEYVKPYIPVIIGKFVGNPALPVNALAGTDQQQQTAQTETTFKSKEVEAELTEEQTELIEMGYALKKLYEQFEEEEVKKCFQIIHLLALDKSLIDVILNLVFVEIKRQRNTETSKPESPPEKQTPPPVKPEEPKNDFPVFVDDEEPPFN